MNIKRSLKSVLLVFILVGFAISCEIQPYPQGERLYNSYCENCHARDGSGLKKLIPPIANSDYLAKNMNLLSCIIKYGVTDSLKVNNVIYTTPMQGNPSLTDTEIANIINFIIHEFDYESQYFSEDQVNEQIRLCF
jgi:cytochrome c